MVMRLALLDIDDTLTGFSVAPDHHTVQPNEIVVPLHCDLVPGQARWLRTDAHPHFSIIVAPPADPIAALQPNALRAIANGLDALFERTGIVMPPETRQWIRWAQRSLDGQE